MRRKNVFAANLLFSRFDSRGEAVTRRSLVLVSSHWRSPASWLFYSRNYHGDPTSNLRKTS